MYSETRDRLAVAALNTPAQISTITSQQQGHLAHTPHTYINVVVQVGQPDYLDEVWFSYVPPCNSDTGNLDIRVSYRSWRTSTHRPTPWQTLASALGTPQWLTNFTVTTPTWWQHRAAVAALTHLWDKWPAPDSLTLAVIQVADAIANARSKTYLWQVTTNEDTLTYASNHLIDALDYVGFSQHAASHPFQAAETIRKIYDTGCFQANSYLLIQHSDRVYRSRPIDKDKWLNP